MPYFSRLTDIVTCNLSSILSQAEDPRSALEEIIREMDQGIAGAERSVRTAGDNVARLETEIGQQRIEVDQWLREAQQAVQNGNEDHARQSLARKHEVEDLIAGLEQQLQAAVATRDHLKTTLNAIQARHADAHRRLRDIAASASQSAAASGEPPATPLASTPDNRIDAELQELKRQMQQKQSPSR